MSYRNKTYVCFDGDIDMNYYRLMCAWKQNDGINFDFYDAHDINYARDTSAEESIKRQLKERLKNTKVFVVLIGENTRNLYKFVRWEMDVALSMGLPIIAVNLNGSRYQDSERCPPIIRDQLAIHISFNAAIMQYALEHWPDIHDRFVKEGKTGPYTYTQDTYKQLGL